MLNDESRKLINIIKELKIYVKRTNSTSHSNLKNKYATDDKKLILKLREDLKQIRSKISHSEREFGPLIYMKKEVTDGTYIFEDIRVEDAELKNTLRKEDLELKEKLRRLKKDLIVFRKNVKTEKYGNSQTVMKLKTTMESIEANISALKDHQSDIYKKLQHEEKITIVEIKALSDRFNNWKLCGYETFEVTPKMSTDPNGTYGCALICTRDAPYDVIEYEKYISKNGGICGGWEEYDHQMFIKAYNRTKGNPSMEMLMSIFPSMTQQSLHHHVGWFSEYNTLLEKRKEAITAWRNKKIFTKNVLADVAMKELKIEENKQREKRKLDALKEELKQTKREIISWKEEKDKRIEDEHTHRVEEEKKTKILEKKQLQIRIKEIAKRQDAKKRENSLNAIRQKTINQISNENNYMLEIEAKRESNETLARFQKRDKIIMRKKVEQIMEKNNEIEKRDERLLKLISSQRKTNAEPARDFNRVTQSTEGSRARAEQQQTEQKQKKRHTGILRTMSAQNYQSRGTPAWRKN